jgi:hypothetical protein
MFTASFVAAGAGTTGLAFAGTTSGNTSIGGGNQVSAPVSVPVDVCGNALALLGGAFAGCQGGAWVSGGESWGGAMTSGNHSIGGGNQVSAPVSVPVDVCGNALALLGGAFAGCQGGAWVQGGEGSGGEGSSGAMTSGNGSILGGNQVRTPVDGPVNVCGNAVGGRALAGCQGGAFAAQSAGAAGPLTSGNHSIGGGNQVKLPVRIPVNVCGNAVAVLGGAAAGCVGGAWTGTSGGSSSAVRAFSPGNVWTRAASPGNAVSTGSLAGPARAPLSGALAGLTSLPMITSLAPQFTGPAQQLTSTVASAASTGRPVSASLLSAAASAPGMGSGSLAGLALGALLSGAAALVAAGRRFRARRAGR